MFLFTTPSATPTPALIPTPNATSPVIDAIRQGAARTGTSFEYLLSTAKRESALDPTAKASTSSATGLFQFIEQTWLGLVKSDGEKLGLADAAAAITPRGDGTLTVADPALRQSILKLREDPQLAAVLAGALTRQNGAALASATGRQATSGELYMAHVLGARGAADLISAAGSDPSRAAALDFPEAARANRNIFYDRANRRPRSTSEVYALLAAGAVGGTGAAVPAAPVASTAVAGTTAVAGPTAVVSGTGAPVPSGLRGLFQTDGRSGPISAEVAKIWRINNEGARTRAAAVAFFPKSVADQAAADAIESTSSTVAVAEAAAAGPAPVEPATAAAIGIPLPPARPSAPALARLGQRQAAALPLDLASFTRSARP